MEQGTFELTQPAVQIQQKLPKVQPGQEVKTISVSMGPKKEVQQVKQSVPINQSKFPSLPAPQASALSLGANLHSSKQLNQKSTKSVPKPEKIDVFRNVLDQVSNQQLLAQGKKEKKPKQQGAQSTKTIKEAYDKQVVENINKLYEKHSDNQPHINYELKLMEKKRNIQLELEKKERILNREKQEHDTLIYQIRQSQQKIKSLDAQLVDLGNTFAKEEDITVLEKRQKDVESLKELISQDHHESSILGNMYEIRSKNLIFNCIIQEKQLLFAQKQCTEAHDDLVIQNQKLGINKNNLGYREKNIESLSKMVQKFRLQNTGSNNLWGSVWKSKFDPQMQNMLEDELSLFEDKRMFNEVINHEKKIEQEKQKAVEEQKRIDQVRIKQEKEKANEKIRQDKKKIENLLNEKRKMFEKLRKVTRVSELDQIIPHKQELQAGKQELEDIEKLIQSKIDKNNAEIQTLHQQIKVLQYQTGYEEEENQKKIDDLDRELNREQDLLFDKEKQVKRVEKSIDEVTVAMSRIMYQLQGKGTKPKNIEIQRDKLVATTSVVSLRLERMLTVLSKKKEFLNEESVNTNPRYLRVPEFIGINSKTYAEMEGKDFIDNDIFVYREEDSLDEHEKYLENERESLKISKAQKLLDKEKEAVKNAKPNKFNARNR